MDICHYCGGEIVLRYVGGGLRPIHISGGYCDGGSGREAFSAQSKFQTVDSYLDPNARCPECGASVFFYRSPHNGRVFFDDVGWPWPKHPCTDRYKGGDEQITRSAKSRFKFHFKGRDGRFRDVYFVGKFVPGSEELLINLKKAERKESIWIAISHLEMSKKDVTQSDIAEAPSLVMTRDEDGGSGTEISFLCGRLQSVVVLSAGKKWIEG